MRWEWGLGLVAVGALVWGSCQHRRASAAQTTRDSVLAVSAVVKAQNEALAAEGNALEARSDSLELARAVDRRRGDSLTALLRRPRPPIPLPDSTVRDSLRYFRARTTALEADSGLAHQALDARNGEIGSLTAALEAQRAASAKFEAAYLGERDRADGLEKVLRGMPVGCARVPLLGIPMPRVGPGAVLTLHGVDPGVAIILPLGGC